MTTIFQGQMEKILRSPAEMDTFGESPRSLTSIYGEIITIPIVAGTVVVVGVLILLTALEVLFEELDELAIETETQKLLNKLKQELMMMGLISFSVFLMLNGASSNFAHVIQGSDWYLAFEVAHILFLFVALAFILQAVFLVNYAIVQGKEYLRLVRATCGSLVEESQAIMEKEEEEGVETMWSCFKSERSWIQNIPFWIPWNSQFRSKVEFKIVGKLFMLTHEVPPDFDFALYMGYLFQEYIAQCGSVSPLSWVCLAILVALNCMKAVVIDDKLNVVECSKLSETKNANSGHLPDGEKTGSYCVEYTLQYAFVLLMTLQLLLIGIHFASSIYLKRIISLGVEKGFSLEMTDANRFDIYMECLENLHETEMKELEREEQENEERDRSAGGKMKKQRSSFQKASSIREYRDSQVRNLEAKIKEKRRRKEIPYMQRKWLKFKESVVEACGFEEKSDVDQCFFASRPSIYFFLVEFSLLLQCFFISVYATQLLSLGRDLYTENSFNAAWWIAGLTVPVFFNFFIFRAILSRAVILKAVTSLHSQVVTRVCEETVEQEDIEEKLREKIYETLDPDQPINDLMAGVKAQFDAVDDDNSGAIGKHEFQTFLENLDVVLSKEKFNMLWSCVDYDLGGSISMDELVMFLFPHLKNSMRGNLDVIKHLHHVLSKALDYTPKSEWLHELRVEFNKIDRKDTGKFTEQQFKKFLADKDVTIGSQQFALLFSIFDTESSGYITFESFVENIFGKELFHGSEGRESFVGRLSKTLKGSSNANGASRGGNDSDSDVDNDGYRDREDVRKPSRLRKEDKASSRDIEGGGT